MDGAAKLSGGLFSQRKSVEALIPMAFAITAEDRRKAQRRERMLSAEGLPLIRL